MSRKPEPYLLRELLQRALEAREMAYAPYSGFAVGAALQAKSGEIYTGCNIENAAYTPSNCAERTAFFGAILRGEREFLAIAVCGGRQGEAALGFCTPCGVCRQVMAEFCGPEFLILCGNASGEYREYTLQELLPERFGPEALHDPTE